MAKTKPVEETKPVAEKKVLSPIDTSKLDARKFHSYKRDPLTGEIVGVGEATKPNKKKESK